MPCNQMIRADKAAPVTARTQYERKVNPTMRSTARIVKPMNGPATSPCSADVRLTSMATPHA